MAKRFGIMIDCSRNAIMKVEELKRYITVLKKMGYNMIQLYTEDTYEVDNEPYFGYLRGRYTKAEMREVVDFCSGIGVEVIPCIQTLAHLENMFKWRTYAPVRDVGNIMLVGEERTYQLIENMVKTCRECFDTSYIHIGMDEAHMLGLGRYLDKNGYRNRFDILKEHLERVLAICEKYSFKPIMWSDMFYRLANEDNYYDWTNITDEIISKKPDGVDLVYWDYYHDTYDFYHGMLESHMRFSGETWFAGGVWTWIGHAPFTTFSIRSMGEAIKACKTVGTDNIFLTLWGDNGKECSIWSVLPALYTLRRMYDDVEDMDLIKREFYEIVGEEYDDMMTLEWANNVAGSDLASPSNVSKTMLYSDPFFGFLDVTVKEGVGAEFARVRDILTEKAERSERFGYLYRVLAALSSVMEIKYDLGVRTRGAYLSGDKGALETILGDYYEAVRRLDEFHLAFSYQWHKENKPHGFEVHDARIGGLRARILACARRLEAYIKGEIDSLPDLEDELLPYDLDFDKRFAINGTPGTDGIPAVDRTSYAISVNNIN